MIKTLRESKAHLSELVNLAARGHDVVITVHGKPKARLTGVRTPSDQDQRTWVAELRKLQRETAGTKPATGSKAIFDYLREDRI